jgi:selenocysteine lyase/cysteine desulfurase
MSAPDQLQCQKSAFSIPADATYLNSAYMGPLSRRVQDAGVAALAVRAFPANISAPDFFAPADAVRTLCAQLVNADTEHVALIPTAAYGIATVAANLPLRSGQNIVLLGEQFPSNVYSWRRLREQGATIRTVAAPQIEDINERARQWNLALLAAIDENTALVAAEHAHWTDGTLFDLASVGARARAVGAWFVVDATQTIGALPFDVQLIKPDALIVHAYKSMLCNYGLGFAVYRDRMAQGIPLEESWLTRAGSENFARLADDQDGYAPGMRRFDTSTRCNPVLIGMLKAACEMLLEWQPERVQAYCYSVARQFVQDARAMGLRIADEDWRAANLFGLHLPQGADAERIRALLAERKIYVSVRGSAIRVAPHVYNDAADLARLAAALKQALAS